MRAALLACVALAGCTATTSGAAKSQLPRTQVDPIRTLAEGIEVYSERVYYPVLAETSEEARARVSPAAALVGIPDQMQGFTRWRVHWKYDTAHDGTACQVTKPQVDLLLRVVMPELFSTAAEDAALRDRWLRYSARLALHEQGHVDIGIACAVEIKRALEAARSQLCSGIHEVVRAATQEVIQRHKALGVQYDAETDHGRKQGVKLP